MNKNDKKKFPLNFPMVIATLVTFALLLSTLAAVPLSWAVCSLVDGLSAGEPIENSGGGKKPSADTSDVITPTTTDKYKFPSDAATKDISSDTDIQSGAIALIDTTDGRAVALKNADTRIYPASMTKVMTLLIGCENAKKDDTLLTVTDAMIKKYGQSYNVGEEGPSTATTWKAGYQVKVIDVLHLIIYKSDTFACWLIAEHVAGSEENFVKLMNNKAASMGLTGTHFTNSTGLFDESHYTTCREMAAIMAAAMDNEKAKSVLMSTSLYSVDVHINGKVNEDASFSMWAAWYTSRLEAYKWGAAAPYYAGNGSDIKIIGGKTGWETIPTACFVTAATDTETGRNYVCVQVGRIDSNQAEVKAKGSTDDTRVTYQKYAKED